MCIDVICANILRYVPEPLADGDGGGSGSSGDDDEEEGCDYDGYDDGGSPRTDVDSSDGDSLSHGRPLSPLAGLPPEVRMATWLMNGAVWRSYLDRRLHFGQIVTN